MIQKFRKKPIIVEAIQFTKNTTLEDLSEFGLKDLGFKSTMPVRMTIPTSEGEMICNLNDWIIKEPFDKKRKFYPCKKDIFEATYEVANSA